MNKQELQLLAQKYLEGKASEEEKRLLNQWYDTTNDGWVEYVNTNTPETEEEVRQRILNSIKQQMPVGEAKKSFVAFKRLFTGSISAAAAVLLVFFGWQLFLKEKSSTPQLVEVPSSKIVEIILPDSSKVWLNEGSVFKYPKKFHAQNRTVELLEGRAYFEIKHQAKQPFIVKTNTLNVTVLGTSFDVRAYHNEGKTKVSVVTGKVGITLKEDAKTPAVMLLPRQEATLNKLSNQLIKAPVKEIAVNAWCKSQLVFEQEDLGNIFKVLEKKYNTKISVNNKKLLNEHISITLGNQPLDSVMRILSFTKHFKYQMANDSISVIR
ncbi:FecR family protein [Pedobacter nutrimenti]|jgi:ferric-dicitrate binding protein FerR (iron transport regulator)|uniref:FecR family protein n=1 Tax=Pedobacter nutrimenti TaxID=1241337 RepID=A0A318UJ32_9SPHI|nr:FecR family protein [Pedobacter nutrimenti]PYF75580.1 FecR family protein [Pedobacter nutrimenti]